MNSAVPPPPPPPPRPPGPPSPPKPPARAEATFNSALEHPPEEREAFIAQACGDDTVLIADVRELALIGGALKDGAITGSDPVRPCGRCRQILNEAAQLAQTDLLIHCASADGKTVERHLLSALLPFAFGPADLGIARGHK